MVNSNRIDAPRPAPIPEGDILAMLAMLDYLIEEIARVDAMSAQCLILARKALRDAVVDAVVRMH